MANMMVFIALALAYALLKIYLEKRLAPLDAGGEEYQLTSVVFSSGGSAYELFQTAAAKWSLPPEKIERDFRQYLQKGGIPHYVRAYLRSHYTADHTYQQLLFSGGRPPYL